MTLRNFWNRLAQAGRILLGQDEQASQSMRQPAHKSPVVYDRAHFAGQLLTLDEVTQRTVLMPIQIDPQGQRTLHDAARHNGLSDDEAMMLSLRIGLHLLNQHGQGQRICLRYKGADGKIVESAFSQALDQHLTAQAVNTLYGKIGVKLKQSQPQ